MSSANTLGGWRRALSPRSAGVVYALLLLVAVLTITTSAQGRPPYLSSVNLSNILDQASLIGILAIFMTLTLITGNFDLSVASTAALAGTVALKLVDQYGALVALFGALLTGAVVGFVNAVLVQKVGVNAFIVTLGTLTAVRGVVQAILVGQSITATNSSFHDFATARWSLPLVVAVVIAALLLIAAVVLSLRKESRLAGLVGTAPLSLSGVALGFVAIAQPKMLTQTAPVWIMLALTVVVSVVLRHTVVGRNLYATGGNSEAARLSGISVDRYKMGAFVLNGVVAAAVGVLYAGRFNSVDPTVLTGGELTVIAAAVLGGTSLLGGSGFVAKSVVGTLILFTLSNGFNVLNIGSNYQNVVQGGVLVAAATLYTATSSRRRNLVRSWFSRRGHGDGEALTPPGDVAEPKATAQTEGLGLRR
ncbi:MAG: transporter permease [Amycolatopsis sp.]|jgi:D-xylose transport system permease protein|uniref:ABC transporter permease n=1 Tax=Amycolatopsis sp. TaxID=37632 RepID=UPI0026183C4C|nr:ABC transporter permease [Amycolatopsis sp.]MCU1682316.1 transporter permease [Amycolatopsis sp.]